MKASSLCFQAAVLFVIAGMIWGIVMAISEDHSPMPAQRAPESAGLGVGGDALKLTAYSRL
jgi:hypothetical protein